MSGWSIVSQSIRFYWRTHLGVLLGVALATMVLTGSLLVGDAVKVTLQHQAELRIGKADEAMIAGDHFFREALADATDAAPAILVRGSVTRPDAAARVNSAQLLAVDARFWRLSPAGRERRIASGELSVNSQLAEKLGVRPGDTLILRLEKPTIFSRDAPLSGEENEVVAIRARVAEVLNDFDYGRFGLQASQVGLPTAFVDLKYVQEKLQLGSRANLLLKRADAAPTNSEQGGTSLRRAVAKDWRLEDAALEVRELKTGGLELRTSRVFLDPAVAKAAPRGVDALTYLVNEIRAGDKAAPYSMVTALDAPSSGFLPAELADNEIVINEWLADDLGVREGAVIKLTYFVMGERRRLEDRSREFTVLAVLPMSEPQLNDSWMPDFPGLADAANCREWKPGFDMDVGKIRDKDEAYWHEHRGTPKAFVNIVVGQAMWGNRWGDLTSIRYPSGSDKGTVSSELRARLSPEQIGMNFLALRQDAFAATRAPVDFGELFVSFSFFLIIAAAVLTALLFVFSVEQRQQQAGLLLAVGWRSRAVLRLFMWEGIALAVLGSLCGAGAAFIYTKLVLHALGTVWRQAVGSMEFIFSPNAWTFAIGIGSGVLVATVAMWLASRRQFRHSARELLAATALDEAGPSVSDAGPGEKRRHIFSPGRRSTNGRNAIYTMLAILCFVGAMALVVWGTGAGEFFGAGSLLLMSGFFIACLALRSLARGPAALKKLGQLATRNAARRRGRSMASIIVFASGVFIVVAVDAFRQRPDSTSTMTDRASGTGGFALIGESALPVYDDLNSAAGRAVFALDDAAMQGVRVVQMRLLEGDDASCLNLNRALQPRLLGVAPPELDRVHAFRAVNGRAVHWSLLEEDKGDGAVPAIVDEATLKWALQKKLGDTLEYRDARGASFHVRLTAALAGSILQGQLLISERHFVEKYPSVGGYRFFLIDAPFGRAADVAEHLSRALQDRGLEVTETWRRLGEFQAVENTYLSIFQVLGGLGLLLGTAGLAIVVARNVLERRQEFALLEAVGFRRAQLRHLVFAEHGWLIAGALILGTISALVAVSPGLRARASGFPFREMAGLLTALVAGSVFWTWVATRMAFRGSGGLAALRSE